ncbi:hypothetical protein E3O23_02955, partial [Cryobacterium tagatosivorans]
MRRRGDPPIDEVAAVTQRLAVLLTAGVSPVSAWTYLLPDEPAVGPAGVATGVAAGDVAAPESSAARVARAAAAAGRR